MIRSSPTPGGKFEDVRDDLKLAIEGKGLVIDYQSYLNRSRSRSTTTMVASR